MKTATLACIALASVVACHAAAADPCAPSTSLVDTHAQSFFTKESATVEDVLSTVQDGYRSRAYIVTWHGSRVLVSDPLAASNKNVGDSLDFIASRHEVDGDRILAFLTTDRRPRRVTGTSGRADPQSSTATASGVVEEVLSAEDNGFRFIGYVVTSEDHQQIAVSDPLALSHHAIGEQIDYLILRAGLPTGSWLTFQVQLSLADRASIPRPSCAHAPSMETGVVDQVLSTDVGGYRYRAYVIEWDSSQIVVDDPTAATDYQAGDRVSFWVSRLQLPSPDGPRNQHFSLSQPSQTTSVNQPTDIQISIQMDTAPVQAVLASDVDGYRSLAYLVNWHNSSIAVTDAFATTHYAAGDRITFSVARATAPSARELSFTLFKFPISRGGSALQPR